ncbi:hypothetical protein M5K25_018140 [Dendrobium thyrsiflorum]|uniref:Uncharacterized protein n=1 Tax=Dendrobium thyrsiflorum TaxID=117978 RepID=A0ABD0UHA5_DENTH
MPVKSASDEQIASCVSKERNIELFPFLPLLKGLSLVALGGHVEDDQMNTRIPCHCKMLVSLTHLAHGFMFQQTTDIELFYINTLPTILHCLSDQQGGQRRSSPTNQRHKIDEWPTLILIPALFTTSKVSSTSSIQPSSTSIQGLITLLKNTWSAFWTLSSKPSKNNFATFSDTLLRTLNKGELLPLFIYLLHSTNLVGDDQVARNRASPFAYA